MKKPPTKTKRPPRQKVRGIYKRRDRVWNLTLADVEAAHHHWPDDEIEYWQTQHGLIVTMRIDDRCYFATESLPNMPNMLPSWENTKDFSHMPPALPVQHMAPPEFTLDEIALALDVLDGR